MKLNSDFLKLQQQISQSENLVNEFLTQKVLCKHISPFLIVSEHRKLAQAFLHHMAQISMKSCSEATMPSYEDTRMLNLWEGSF